MRLEYLNEERYCAECGSRPVHGRRRFCRRCTILRQREGIGEAEPDFDDEENVSASEFLGATSHLDAPKPVVKAPTAAPAPDDTTEYTAEQVYELYTKMQKSGNTKLAKQLYDKWLEM